MRKAILTTICWAAIFFVIFALAKYLRGGEYWLIEALAWVIPASVGYFIGYLQGNKDKNR